MQKSLGQGKAQFLTAFMYHKYSMQTTLKLPLHEQIFHRSFNWTYPSAGYHLVLMSMSRWKSCVFLCVFPAAEADALWETMSFRAHPRGQPLWHWVLHRGMVTLPFISGYMSWKHNCFPLAGEEAVSHPRSPAVGTLLMHYPVAGKNCTLLLWLLKSYFFYLFIYLF